MNRILVVVFAMAVGACAVEPDEATVQSDLEAKQLLDYKAGTWNCTASYTPQAAARTLLHTATGKYTIVNLGDGHLRGSYREAPSSFPAGDFDDFWTITGEPSGPKGGSFGATYNVTFGHSGDPQGPAPTASLVTAGFVQPGINATVLGFEQFEGHLTFFDGVSVGFLGSDFGFASPTRISRQWNVETDPGSFSPYFRLNCTLQ